MKGDIECCKKSFFQSAADTAMRLAKDPRRAPTHIQTERLNICTSCEYNQNGKCMLCHCIIDLKVRPRNMTCPINKWTEWTDEDEVQGVADSPPPAE